MDVGKNARRMPLWQDAVHATERDTEKAATKEQAQRRAWLGLDACDAPAMSSGGDRAAH